MSAKSVCYVMYAHFVSPVSYNFPSKTLASCNLVYLFACITYYCSASVITLVLVERYFAVCRPMYYRRTQSRTNAFKAMRGVWVVSLLLTVMTLLKRGELVEYCLVWPDDERYSQMPTKFRSCGPVGGNQRIMGAMEIFVLCGGFVQQVPVL